MLERKVFQEAPQEDILNDFFPPSDYKNEKHTKLYFYV